MGIRSSKSEIRITLPHKDLCIGDSIAIKLDINNEECKKDLDHFSVKLKQNVSYRAGNVSESYKTTICDKTVYTGALKKEKKEV